MKKTLISTALAAVVAFAVMAPAAHAANGTATFSGSVTEETCTINGNGTGNVDVTLPPVAKSALPTANATANTTPFALVLTGCSTTMGNVHAFWNANGAFVDMANGQLKQLDTSAGAASGVQIQLLNADGSVIDASKSDIAHGANQNSKETTLVGGAATLNYAAQYIATGTTVSAGPVLAKVQYDLIYD